MTGAKCSSGCLSRSHRSYGECLKSKSVATTGLESTGPGFSRSAQQKWDKELDTYQGVLRQGIQPTTTNMKDIEAAVKVSEVTGEAFRADA